ncbi:MAG: hypothetical protein QM813_00795 [Verrucomicrobiota bacterium]
MDHYTEDELVLAYYGEHDRKHLDDCAECRDRFAGLADELDRLAAEMPVPERGDDYGR